jgi:hypothetical protein
MGLAVGIGLGPTFGTDVWTPGRLGLDWALVQPGGNVWQDAAGTTPAAAAADPVGLFALAGPGGLSFTAAGTARPVLAQAGGVWVIRFDGSNDQLQCAADYRPDPATVIWLGNYRSGGTANPRFFGFGMTRGAFLGRDQAAPTNNWWYYQDTAGIGVVDSGLGATALCVFTARLETGVNHLPRRNGVNGAVNFKPLVGPTERMILGTSGAATGENGACDLAGIAAGAVTLSDAQCLQAERYLGVRAGLVF